MITTLRTILPLLILTTTLIPSATASTILKSEVRGLSDYRSLTACQKKCIAGTPGTLTDKISLFYLTKCETKTCFCPSQNEPQIGKDAQKCLETEGSGVCATVEEYNGLMAFVAKYCGFEYVPATASLLFPPSGGTTTSTLGATATPSCWDRFGSPVTTAGCSSSMMTATRTSDSYLTSTDASNSSTFPTDLFGDGNGKGKGGLGLGTIIGLGVFGFVVFVIMSGFGCYFLCPCICGCCCGYCMARQRRHSEG